MLCSISLFKKIAECQFELTLFFFSQKTILLSYRFLEVVPALYVFCSGPVLIPLAQFMMTSCRFGVQSLDVPRSSTVSLTKAQ